MQVKELFDSIAPQNAENSTVANSLPLFLKYSVKCLFFKRLYQTIENLKYKALNFSELYDRIKSVAIFGHSLGETDHTYFNKLFQESCMYNKFSTNNNKEFWLFYYKENGYHCMMQQLDSLTHNSLTSFRQYNRVNFINTDKEKVFI